MRYYVKSKKIKEMRNPVLTFHSKRRNFGPIHSCFSEVVKNFSHWTKVAKIGEREEREERKKERDEREERKRLKEERKRKRRKTEKKERKRRKKENKERKRRKKVKNERKKERHCQTEIKEIPSREWRPFLRIVFLGTYSHYGSKMRIVRK